MPAVHSVLGFASLLFGVGYSHSWVECTDYDITVDIDSDSFLTDYYGSEGFDFHPGCSGYTRDRLECDSTQFDTCGMGWQPFSDDDNGVRMCRYSLGSSLNDYSSTYNEQYPMAQYVVGNRYRLLWPAKNHAGYECQGDQRDNEMQLWVNLNPYPTEDIDPFISGEVLYSELEEAGYTLVIDWHAASGETFDLRDNDEFDENVYGQVFDNVGIDGVPFQNCPHFCEDMDDAVCYGDFDLPDIFPEDGIYTFVWWWEFKSHEKYSHCYEANVTGTTSSGGNGGGGGGGSSNKNGSGNTDSAGTILWSLFTFVLVFGLVAGLCLILKKKEMIVCDDNKIIFQKEPQKAPIATHSVTNLANVVQDPNTPPADTNSYAAPARTSATRPPPPPPVR